VLFGTMLASVVLAVIVCLEARNDWRRSKSILLVLMLIVELQVRPLTILA
jgi:hypothetical protein